MKPIQTTRCRACGKEIFFIPTSLYKKQPVDADPVYIVPDTKAPGAYVLPSGGTIKGRIVHDEEIEKGTEIKMAYVSHFATCTRPQDFRKPRDREKGAQDNG